MIEAAFKERDFDPHFCLGFVSSIARNLFITEVIKATEVYSESCDNQSSALVIRKILRNMKENHQQRQLKITKEQKIDKVFRYLYLKNEEAENQIARYKQRYIQRQSSLPVNEHKVLLSPAKLDSCVSSPSLMLKGGSLRKPNQARNRNSMSINNSDSMEI